MSTDYGMLVRDDRVHGSLYVDPSVFREEMERIFHRGWSFVGHESEIPKPGDWVQRRIGLESYLLTRDADGGIHVLANRCSHRGTALCWQEGGSSRTLQCTFHGWTFALDGKLLGVTYPGGFSKQKSDLGLDRAGQTGNYRGFIFANPSGDAGPLEAHLGAGGAALIDRACRISPTGRIRLAPNWIGQRTDSNWKMWPESDNDGYHLQFLHISTWRAIPNNQYGVTMLGGENGNRSRAVDHGRGHIELDLRPSYPSELAWMATTPDKQADYRAAMCAAYGEDEATRILWEGPPHAMIFPNLFLGEINIARVEPVEPGVTVHHHTAIQLEGAGDAVNQRLRRMSEGAMGPGSFLLPEDAVTAERMQCGFGGTAPGMARGEDPHAWVDLSRGQERERQEPGGARVGLLSDEVTNRGFWRHYRTVMGAGDGNGPMSDATAITGPGMSTQPLAVPEPVALPEPVRRELEAFLYLEARLADESRYDAWEALVTDDMHYWVPKGPPDHDPSERIAYINDNRSRLATRIRQLGTGKRYAQTPPSPMRRVLSNIEVLEADDRKGEYRVAANFVLYEVAAQTTGDLRIWPGRATWRLRRVGGRLRMAQKIVELVTSNLPQPNLAFIL